MTRRLGWAAGATVFHLVEGEGRVRTALCGWRSASLVGLRDAVPAGGRECDGCLRVFGSARLALAPVRRRSS